MAVLAKASLEIASLFSLHPEEGRSKPSSTCAELVLYHRSINKKKNSN
jgi:hypothetical protein